MKQMRTDLTPLRLARCKAVIEGYGPDWSFRAFRDLCGMNIAGMIDMLTDDAVEKWAFKLMEDRRTVNRTNARNRARVAARKVEGDTVTTPDLEALEDVDHFARVAVIARTIPDDVDLDDEDDVIRALFLARYCANDFDSILDDVIECAKVNRMEDIQ